MKKLTLAVTALTMTITMISSCKKKDEITELPSVKIGALLSLTGNWSTLGITSKAAMEIAIEDVNSYMKEEGSNYRFKPVIYDSKLDAALATQQVAEAKTQGYQFVLGPQSSAEAAAVKDYANANDIIIVSQGSTAGSLSIENDNLFRFCPDDKLEGAAMAKTIYNEGMRAIITVARDDAGNRGLQTSTGSAFTALGGRVAALTPYSTQTADYGSLIDNIRSAIFTQGNFVNINQIAVYLASFDECVEVFKAAANDPTLSSVRWYGGDGAVLSAALTANATAANFSITTRFFAPTYGLPKTYNVTWNELSEEIERRTGIVPDAFALASYDAVWVMALSYAKFTTGTHPSVSELKAEFVTQANLYEGATGPTKLNAAGDRATGTFDYWGLVTDGNGYKWQLVGKSE
jgi:branched-chain amino acid transport system substrate-binding protein